MARAGPFQRLAYASNPSRPKACENSDRAWWGQYPTGCCHDRRTSLRTRRLLPEPASPGNTRAGSLCTSSLNAAPDDSQHDLERLMRSLLGQGHALSWTHCKRLSHYLPHTSCDLSPHSGPSPHHPLSRLSRSRSTHSYLRRFVQELPTGHLQHFVFCMWIRLWDETE